MPAAAVTPLTDEEVKASEEEQWERMFDGTVLLTLGNNKHCPNTLMITGMEPWASQNDILEHLCSNTKVEGKAVGPRRIREC